MILMCRDSMERYPMRVAIRENTHVTYILLSWLDNNKRVILLDVSGTSYYLCV